MLLTTLHLLYLRKAGATDAPSSSTDCGLQPWRPGGSRKSAYRKIDTQTPGDCCSACASDSKCDYFTVNTTQTTSGCHLKQFENGDRKIKYNKCKVCYTSATSGPSPAPTPAPMPKDKRNILYIVVDDLRNELGFTNNRKGLVTPNIDALAAKGMIFDRSYIQQGVCSPSRNSFLSGRRPDTTKIWNFEQSFRDYLGDNVSSWPGAFKNAGWITSGMVIFFHKI